MARGRTIEPPWVRRGLFVVLVVLGLLAIFRAVLPALIGTALATALYLWLDTRTRRS